MFFLAFLAIFGFMAIAVVLQVRSYKKNYTDVPNPVKLIVVRTELKDSLVIGHKVELSEWTNSSSNHGVSHVLAVEGTLEINRQNLLWTKFGDFTDRDWIDSFDVPWPYIEQFTFAASTQELTVHTTDQRPIVLRLSQPDTILPLLEQHSPVPLHRGA